MVSAHVAYSKKPLTITKENFFASSIFLGVRFLFLLHVFSCFELALKKMSYKR